jgi:hypothetical protein
MENATLQGAYYTVSDCAAFKHQESQKYVHTLLGYAENHCYFPWDWCPFPFTAQIKSLQQIIHVVLFTVCYLSQSEVSTKFRTLP